MDSIADYDAWKLKQQNQAANAANIVLQATPDNPDELAGDLHLASEFGKVTGNPVPPVPMVKEYRSVFQQKIEQQRNQSILSGAPRLADWLRNPENAALSRDDLERLAWFERFGINPNKASEVSFGQGIANTAKRGLTGIGQGYNQLMFENTEQRARDRKMTFDELVEDSRGKVTDQAGNEHASWDGSEYLTAMARWVDARYADLIGTDDQTAATEFLTKVGEAQERIKSIPKSDIATDFQNAAMKDGASLGEAVANFGQAIVANPSGAFAWMFETAGENFIQLGAALGTSALTRNPAAGIAVAGAGTYATERFRSPGEFFEEKGIDLTKPEDVQRVMSDPALIQEAAERGVIRGLVISAFDMVGFGVAGRSLAGNPFVEAIAQGMVQALSGAGGEYAARLAAGQEVDWNEVLAEGLAEFVTAPIDMGVAGRRFQLQRRQAEEAEGRKAVFEALSTGAQSSTLRNRMPDRFREFVERATADGPVENVYIPAEQFQTYFQSIGIDPRSLIGELEGVSIDDFDIALAGGGDLKIPTATFAAKIAGTEYDAGLVEHMRFDPDQMTLAEAQAFNERSQELLQEAYEEAERLRQEAEEFRTFEQEIRETIISRFRQAGRGLNEAEAMAELYVAQVRTAADEEGMTIDDYLKQYPLPEVRGDLPRGVQFKNVDELTRFIAEAKSQKPLRVKRNMTLLEFIDDYGGINDPGGELKARNASEVKRGTGKRSRRLKLERAIENAGQGDMLGGVDKQGRAHGVDDVARAAIEAGYLRNHPVAAEYIAAMARGDQTPDISAALWDAIDAELRGELQRSDTDVVNQDRADRERALDEFDEYLNRLGVSLDDPEDVIRAAIEQDQEARRADGQMYEQGRLNTESEAFKRWFGDSKVVDENGEPLVMYHGTPAMIGEDFAFDPRRISERGSASGYGFYFTSDRATAEGYKPEDGGSLAEVYLSIQKPLPVDAKAFPKSTIAKIVERLIEKDIAENGSDWRDTFVSNFVDTYSMSRAAAVRETASMISEGSEKAIDQIAEIANVYGSKDDAMRAVRDVTGYDGIFTDGYDNKGSEGGKIFVAWFPEQIKSVHNRGTWDASDPRIMFQSADPVGSEAFSNWFGDSKVVDENGEPLVVYHGTSADFDAFDPSRLGEATDAASARMGFFFAGNPEVASSYADTSNPYQDGDSLIVRSMMALTGGRYEKWNEWLLGRLGLQSGVPSGANVMPVYLSIQNPLVYDFKGQEYRETTYAAIINEARENGHDGVILRNTFDEGFVDNGNPITDVYVAFSPTQIKSVNNRGTWDPNDARVLYQGGGVSSAEVDAFASSLQEELGLRSLSMFLSGSGDLKLNMIAVNKDAQGRGTGSEALRRIAEFADQHGLRLTLTTGLPDDGFGTTSKARLIKFYKRFGFVENKGRNKDFSISDNMYREPQGRTYNQSAYHGTPHLFEKFSLDHIGTGEGAQAYGWGLYFAGRKEVAQHYRSRLSPRKEAFVDGSPAKNLPQVVWEVADDMAANGRSVDGYIALQSEYRENQIERAIEAGNEARAEALRDILREEIAAAESLRGKELEWRDGGRLFTVDIPEDSELLDWDASLSEQPEAVREKLATVYEDADPNSDDYDPSEPFQTIYMRLVQKYGSDRAASEALLAAGIPGHRYLDGISRTDGDGSRNYVIYDDQRVEVRHYDQRMDRIGSGPLGSITVLPNGKTIIDIFNGANFSTGLHESGHLWLLNLQARAANGSQVANERLSAVKAWWRENADLVAKDAMRSRQGVEVTADDVRAAIDVGTTGNALKDEAIDVGMQEQFARATEAYLMEGKAPTAALRETFAKFRSWLLAVYRKILRLAGNQPDNALGLRLTDDMRRVFDRILATEDEINKARQSINDDDVALFASAEAMGLSPEEYARYLKLRDRAREDALTKLQVEIMEPVLREEQEWYKAEKAKVRAEVEKDINSWRVYRAFEWMGNRRWIGSEDKPEALPDMRFDKAVLVRRYGEGVLKTLPRGKFTVYAVEGGMDPDDVAPWFGYASGDEMIRDMEQAPRRADAIADETERLMRERWGDPLNDGDVELRALDALHSDKRTDQLAAEYKAVAEVAGVKVDLTAKIARATATETLARMTVRDAMASNRFLAAERKASADVARYGAMLAREKVWMDQSRRRIASKARAALKGKGEVGSVETQVERANASTGNYNETVQKFLQAKRRQILNQALYMESRKISDEVAKAERFVKKLNARSHREKIAGAGRRDNAQIDYLAAIDDLLHEYDFRRMSGRQEARRMALVAYIEAMKAASRDNELGIPDRLLGAGGAMSRPERHARAMADAGRTPYKAIPVEEFRGVIDALKSIEHSALKWNEFIVNQKKRELDEAAATIADAIRDNIGSSHQEWAKKADAKYRGEQFLKSYLSTVRSATAVLRQIDGREDLGPVYELLKADFDRAAIRELEMSREAGKKLQELFDLYSKDEQRDMAIARVHLDLRGQSFSKWNLIAMALNMGNEGNLARLTNEKARKHLLPHEVEIVANMLDERDAKFVQGIWDLIDSYWPQIAERDRRVKGVAPQKVDARPVTIGGVDLRGGYYPIKYDGEHGGGRPLGDSDDDILQSIMGGGYASAHTKDGHLKARGANGRQSLSLEVSNINRHLNEVIHDLTYSEPVVNTWRMLTHGSVESAFVDAGMQIEYQQLKLWVQDVATGQVGSGSEFAKALTALRGNFAFSKLAFNIKSIIMQPLGVTQSAVVVGKGRMARYMLKMLRNGRGLSSEVEARSSMMKMRRDIFNKDLMDLVQKSQIAGPTRGKVRDFIDDVVVPYGMAGMTFFQYYSVDVPTWAAAYEKGMEQFDGDEGKAIHFADMTVQRAQGSGIWADRSGVERGTLSAKMRQNPFVTLLTMLGSYFFTKTNLAIERTQQLQAEGVTAASAMSYALDMALLYMGEALVIAMVQEMFDDDDDDDNETFAGRVMKETMGTAVAGLPVARDVAGVMGGFDGGAYASIANTFAKPLVQAAQGELDAALVKSTINLSGMLFRLPSAQINRVIDAGWRDAEGEDVAPVEYLFGRNRN